MNKRPFNWLYLAVVDYLGGKCIYCSSRKRLELHHIIPSSRGGSDSLGNLEVVCLKCHRKIHKQINKVLPLKVLCKCKICGKPLVRRYRISYATCEKCYKKKQYHINKKS